jgi:hypothetical protein
MYSLTRSTAAAYPSLPMFEAKAGMSRVPARARGSGPASFSRTSPIASTAAA